MDFTINRRAVIAVVVVIGVAVGAWWFLAHRGDDADFMKPAPLPEAVEHDKGGSAKVVVLTPPELTDAGQGGDTLRSLVLPKLFVAQPDGTWRASLVEPGSDTTTRDALTARFKLRQDANWSDASPITVEDLRRSADARWVKSISEPDGKGFITLELKSAYPNWRSLWSGSASVEPASRTQFGGPFVIDMVTSGLQTVLKANPRWYGTEGGPFLDEVSLVIAADNTLGRQLLATDQVDVFTPFADTIVSEQLRRLDGVKTSVDQRSGAWTGLRITASLQDGTRQELAAKFPRELFVKGLLDDEASLLDGFLPDDRTWATPPTYTGAVSQSFTFATPANVPLMVNAQRAAQSAYGALGHTVTVKALDPAGVDAALDNKTFEVLVQMKQEGPSFCWSCTFGDVDPALASKADGGDTVAAAALEAKARDSGVFMPLWRPYAVVGWRTADVSGPVANGYAVGTAWNANLWWKP